MMKESLYQTVSRASTQENSYTNSLFNTFTVNDMNEKNFPLFKKDFENILMYLAAYMKSLLIQFTPDLIDNKDKRNSIMSNIYTQSKRLEEYCHFFRVHGGKTSPSYEYFGSIAHKLKTLGGSINGLLMQLKDIDNAQEKKEDFQEAKEILAYSIDKIIATKERVANLEFKEQSFYKKILFSPLKTTQDIIKPYTSYIQEKNIKIIDTLADNDTIISNMNIFEIVMDNLISNAIKFTPRGGTITIGMEDTKGLAIKFFVQNSGTGIAPDGDPFAYGYTTPGLDGQIGTGIGLAQCKIFLKIVDGAIWYENIPTGGTKFSFELKRPLEKNTV